MKPYSWSPVTFRFESLDEQPGILTEKIMLILTSPVSVKYSAALSHDVSLVGISVGEHPHVPLINQLQQRLDDQLFESFVLPQAGFDDPEFGLEDFSSSQRKTKDFTPGEIDVDVRSMVSQSLLQFNPSVLNFLVAPIFGNEVVVKKTSEGDTTEYLDALSLSVSAVVSMTQKNSDCTLLASNGVKPSFSHFNLNNVDVSFAWKRADDFAIYHSFVSVFSEGQLASVSITSQRCAGLVVEPNKLIDFGLTSPGFARRRYVLLKNNFGKDLSVSIRISGGVDAEKSSSAPTESTSSFMLPHERFEIENGAIVPIAVDYLPSADGIHTCSLFFFQLIYESAHSDGTPCLIHQLTITGSCGSFSSVECSTLLQSTDLSFGIGSSVAASKLEGSFGIASEIAFEFGLVPLGSASIHELFLINHSIVTFELLVFTSPPFSSSSMRFELESDKRAHLVLCFCPKHHGDYCIPIQISNGLEVKTFILRGQSGFIDVSLQSDVIQFSHLRAGSALFSDLLVSNTGSLPLSIDFDTTGMASQFQVIPVETCESNASCSSLTFVEKKRWWFRIRKWVRSGYIHRALTNCVHALQLPLFSYKPSFTPLTRMDFINTPLCLAPHTAIKFRVRFLSKSQGSFSSHFNVVYTVVTPKVDQSVAARYFSVGSTDPAWVRADGSVNLLLDLETLSETHENALSQWIEHKVFNTKYSSKVRVSGQCVGGVQLCSPSTISFGIVPASRFGSIDKNQIEAAITYGTILDANDIISIDRRMMNKTSFRRGTAVSSDAVSSDTKRRSIMSSGASVSAPTDATASVHVLFAIFKNESMTAETIVVENITPPFSVRRQQYELSSGYVLRIPIIFTPQQENCIYTGSVQFRHEFGAITIPLHGVGAASAIYILEEVPVKMSSCQLNELSRKPITIQNTGLLQSHFKFSLSSVYLGYFLQNDGFDTELQEIEGFLRPGEKFCIYIAYVPLRDEESQVLVISLCYANGLLVSCTFNN